MLYINFTHKRQQMIRLEAWQHVMPSVAYDTDDAKSRASVLISLLCIGLNIVTCSRIIEWRLNSV